MNEGRKLRIVEVVRQQALLVLIQLSTALYYLRPYLNLKQKEILCRKYETDLAEMFFYTYYGSLLILFGIVASIILYNRSNLIVNVPIAILYYSGMNLILYGYLYHDSGDYYYFYNDIVQTLWLSSFVLLGSAHNQITTNILLQQQNLIRPSVMNFCKPKLYILISTLLLTCIEIIVASSDFYYIYKFYNSLELFYGSFWLEVITCILILSNNILTIFILYKRKSQTIVFQASFAIYIITLISSTTAFIQVIRRLIPIDYITIQTIFGETYVKQLALIFMGYLNLSMVRQKLQAIEDELI